MEGAGWGMSLLKYLLLLTFAAAGFTTLRLNFDSLRPPYCYHKDFVQDYVIAAAVLAGTDPYRPVNELVRLLLPDPVPLDLPHPSPHPPFMVLLTLPLGALGYEKAAAVWLALELVCLAVVAVAIASWWGGGPPKVLPALMVWLAILGWSPVREELLVGQHSALLLAVLTVGWLSGLDARPLRAGCLLGSAVALKLVFWPFLVWLGLTRRWTALSGALFLLISANLGAGVILGWEPVWRYYTDVGPAVAHLYRSRELNFSAWSVGWRIFEGVGSPTGAGFEAAALIDAPALAPVTSAALALLILGLGLRLAYRSTSVDSSVGILVCVCILTSPVAWNHYLTLLILPLAIVAWRLRAFKYPKLVTNAFLVTLAVLLIPRIAFRRFAREFADVADSVRLIPGPAALVGLVPAIAVFAVAALLWSLTPPMGKEQVPLPGGGAGRRTGAQV